MQNVLQDLYADNLYIYVVLIGQIIAQELQSIEVAVWSAWNNERCPSYAYRFTRIKLAFKQRDGTLEQIGWSDEMQRVSVSYYIH